MTNEAVLRDTKILTSKRYACATGTGIARGTYLKNADPTTASASTGTADAFVGFAHADVNKATDTDFNTETSVTADKGGYWDLLASGAIPINSFVVTAAPGNMVKVALSADMLASVSRILGIAREAATDGETINVEVFP